MRAFRSQREHSALYGLSAEFIADVCKVHVTTSRRWKRGEEPPYAALQWIELMATGNLEILDPEWQGWRIRDGKLIDPSDYEHTPGQILGIPFLRQLIAHYQSEQRYPVQADWVDELWKPAEVSVL